jgi:pimeloyl-ACP methyl ester carboxylesterase
MEFSTFSRELIPTIGGSICVRRAGRGPAVLLLHGFPETSLAWRKVAPALAKTFTVVAADLPGYGDSTLSAEALDDDRLSKRTMAHAVPASSSATWSMSTSDACAAQRSCAPLAPSTERINSISITIAWTASARGVSRVHCLPSGPRVD